MTERVASLFVALEQDTRDDDVQELVQAIGQLRGVAHVTLGPVVDHTVHIERQRFRHNLAAEVYDMIIGEKARTSR